MAKRSPAPTVRRRRLGAELRRLREAAGKSMQDAADLLSRTIATVSNLERGKYEVNEQTLAVLLGFYDVGQNERAALETLRSDAAQRGWWVAYGRAVPESFKAYLGLESDATALDTYEQELIPGLLQTVPYIRAVHEAAGTAPKVMDRAVSARLDRQRRLTSESSLVVRAVLSEGALRRAVGGPEVMRGQLDHLLTLNQRENIDVKVLPFAAGGHGSMAGTFSVLFFRTEDEYPPVACIDYPRGTLYLEEDEVDPYVDLFGDLWNCASSSEKTAELIAAALTTFDSQRKEAS